jgi:hypothetical protein
MLKVWVINLSLSVGILSRIFLIDIQEINIRGFIQIHGSPNQDIIPSTGPWEGFEKP